MKRLMINVFAFMIIISGGLLLSGPSKAMVYQPSLSMETKCGSCSTDDPDKCCKQKLFKRCEIYYC